MLWQFFSASYSSVLPPKKSWRYADQSFPQFFFGGRSEASKLSAKPVKTDPHDDALLSLEKCFHELHVQAVGLVSAHWEQVLAKEKALNDWKEKSCLQLASHRKGNHIQLKWIGNKWFGAKSTRRTVKTNIIRNKDDLSYSTAKLKVLAKEWELPIVIETERKLTTIRKQAYFVTRSIVALRNAKATANNNPLILVDDETSESDSN